MVFITGIYRTVEKISKIKRRKFADVSPYWYFVMKSAINAIQYIVVKQIIKIRID